MKQLVRYVHMYRLPPQLLQHGYLIQDKMKPELMATHLELVCMAMVTAPDSISWLAGRLAGSLCKTARGGGHVCQGSVHCSMQKAAVADTGGSGLPLLKAGRHAEGREEGCSKRLAGRKAGCSKS